MNERQMHRADFVTGLFLLAFGVTVTVMSIQMPRLEIKEINPYTVPGIVPGFLGVIIGVMSVVMIIRAVINRGFKLGITPEGIRAWLAGVTARRLLMTLMLTLVYSLGLVGTLPYTPATILFVWIFILVFEWEKGMSNSRKRRVAIFAGVEAVVATLVIAGIFRYLFLVDLP